MRLDFREELMSWTNWVKMSIISPTITVSSKDYETYINRYSKFAKRIHIDLSDGVFTPNSTISTDQIYWPLDLMIDLHLMYQNPMNYLEDIINLKPNLAIVHAEVDFNVQAFFGALRTNSIKCGIAILPQTEVKSIQQLITSLDHILIFSGHLGFYGGQADLNLLSKVDEIKQINPHIEISWDGGINLENVKQISDRGVNVLNVGGYISTSHNPEETYKKLVEVIS